MRRYISVRSVSYFPLKMFSFLIEEEFTPSKSQQYLFVCVEVLRPSQPNGVMSSAVSLPNHTFTGQA